MLSVPCTSPQNRTSAPQSRSHSSACVGISAGSGRSTRWDSNPGKSTMLSVRSGSVPQNAASATTSSVAATTTGDGILLARYPVSRPRLTHSPPSAVASLSRGFAWISLHTPPDLPHLPCRARIESRCVVSPRLPRIASPRLAVIPSIWGSHRATSIERERFGDRERQRGKRPRGLPCMRRRLTFHTARARIEAAVPEQGRARGSWGCTVSPSIERLP
jgi:hypothetical protein